MRRQPRVKSFLGQAVITTVLLITVITMVGCLIGAEPDYERTFRGD